MASDYVLDAFERALRSLFDGEVTVRVHRLENNQDPEKLIGRSSQALGLIHVLLRDEPSQQFRNGIGQTANVNEQGVVDIDVICQGGNETAAAEVRTRMKQIEDVLWTGALTDDDIDIFGITAGPDGPRFGGKWWGRMIAPEFYYCGS